MTTIANRATSPSSDAELIEKWIIPDPHGRGRWDARVRNHGVSVWALVAYLRAILADGEPQDAVARVAASYKLPREAVEAALAYYKQNKELIDAWLLINDS